MENNTLFTNENEFTISLSPAGTDTGVDTGGGGSNGGGDGE